MCCGSFYNMHVLLMSESNCLGLKCEYYKTDLEYLVQNDKNSHDKESLMLLICDTLNILCENDIMNGNLKSSNIIYIEEECSIKIIDLFYNDLRRKENLRLYDLNFLSPEAIQNKEIDSSSMIWSVGCIFYEILTKELPFATEDRKSFMNNYSHLAEQKSSKIPSNILYLLKRIFDINPENRPKINEIKNTIKMEDNNKDKYLISNEIGTIILQYDLHLIENSSIYFTPEYFLKSNIRESIK